MIKRNLISGFMAVLMLALPNRGQSGQSNAEGIETILSEPTIISTKQGQIAKGRIGDIDPDRVQIITGFDEGTVTYTFEKTSILNISLPGEELKFQALQAYDKGIYDRAVVIMEALYRQRQPLLSYLPDAEAEFFIHYLEALLKVGHPARAIALGGMLKAHISMTTSQNQIDDIILLGHYQLGLFKESANFARAWIKKAPRYHNSALGWWVAAIIAYREGNYEAVLETAFIPIVFSGYEEVPYLSHCYAVAICALAAERNFKEADRMMGEMQKRNLEWPGDIQGTTLQADLKRFRQNKHSNIPGS